MPRYLLTCACGTDVAVEIGQAGGQVRCQCGATLDVPPLRRMRHLPVESTAKPIASRPWQLRSGLVAACLVVAMLLAVAAGGVWLTEPKVDPIDLASAHQNALQRIEEMSPAEWWDLWNYRYRPEVERGFTVYQNRLQPEDLYEQSQKRRIEKALLILAAASTAAAGLIGLWPANQTGRQGDKSQTGRGGETRR